MKREVWCLRCGGTGYLAVRNGDDSIDCPECLGTGENVQALIASYEARYRYPMLLGWILEADKRALESARDEYWYICGKYEETGHDRHGRSYTTYDETDTELDQLLEDEIVKEEHKYGY